MVDEKVSRKNHNPARDDSEDQTLNVHLDRLTNARSQSELQNVEALAAASAYRWISGRGAAQKR